MSKTYQFILTLAGVMLIGFSIAIIPYYLNGWFLTTPDAGGLACGAQALAQTGHFSDGHTANLGYNFNICWTKEFYPSLQLFHAQLLHVWQRPAWELVIVTSVATFMACVIGMFLLAWRMTDNLMIAGVTGVLSSCAPMLLRSLVLTPQNLYGYCFIIVMMIIFVELVRQPRRWWWWIGLVATAAGLAFTHILSFGIAGITFALWFLLFYLRSWRSRCVIVLAIAMVIAVVVWGHVLPVSLKVVFTLFGGVFSGYDHPLYDHPAIWGYIVTLLAGVGIFLSAALSKKMYWLLACWLIIPVFMAHLSWFHLTLLPDRFVAFSWMSLTVFAASGLMTLKQRLKLDWNIFIPLAMILMSAQFVHSIIYVKDDVAGWSARFRPHPAFTQALGWLNQQSDKGTLVGIMAVANREITFAPIWYDHPVASYPWYNLNHRNIKSFTAESALYQGVFSDPTNPEYLRVQAFYSMITKPNSDAAYAAMSNYHLKYFILPKNSQANAIWRKKSLNHFSQIYENEAYRLFKLY